jgi:hypothetical protein
MVEAEAAQRGVLQAILSLHEDRKFTALLDDLCASVQPKYFALNLPIPQEPELGVPPEAAPLGSYARSSRDRRQRQAEYEDALQQWARRFRLTDDLTETGECLPWILDFGRRACEDRSFTVPPGRRAGERVPPPWGSAIPASGPNEKLPEWFARIRPLALALRRAARQQQRSRPYPDPAKRNPDHYRWFVLRVCGGLTPGKILERLNIHDADESTIRKAVKSVSSALGLPRKIGPQRIARNRGSPS